MQTFYDVYLGCKLQGTFYSQNIALCMAKVYRKKGYSVQIVKCVSKFVKNGEKVLDKKIIYDSDEYESVLDKRSEYLSMHAF